MDADIVKGSEIFGPSIQGEREYKVKLYDFRRPDKFSLDQIRTLSVIHETFARLARTALSGILRLGCDLKVASVDQLTYEEFIRSVPNPSMLAVISMDPLPAAMLMELDPAPGFAVVERLFGGQGGKEQPSRETTEVESRFIEELISQAFLPNLGEAWRKIVDLKPGISGTLETHPAFCAVVPPAEMVVLASLAVGVGGSAGKLNLCYPYITIEPVVNRLGARYWYSDTPPSRPERRSFGTIASLKADSALTYRGEDLCLHDLWNLRRGSLVEIPDFGEGKALLDSGGVPVMSLEKREKGFEVTTPVVVSDADRRLLSARQPAEDSRADVSEPSDPRGALHSDLSEMNRKLQEIADRQDELTDQLLFSAPDRDVPTEGYSGRMKPFGFVRMADTDGLLGVIRGEHPQTIALVLSCLDPHMASRLLGRLPEELQPDVVRRIATIDHTDPRILEKLEGAIQKKYSLMGAADAVVAGGVPRVVDLLNMSSRSVEKRVVESLEGSHPELAEDIKRRMFVFEDIVLLDDRAVKEVLRNADSDDLLLAVKAVPREVREKVDRNLPKGKGETFAADVEKIGPVKLSEVEAAQQRIVSVIRRKEEEGAIVVARPDETVV